MLKVILADSHGTITGKDQNSCNLGLLYLASYIRASDFKADFKYLSMIYSEKDHLDEIEKWKPDVYAVSLTSFTVPRTYKLINAIKTKFPDLMVICGGSHPTAAYEDVLKKTKVDVVCVGEGERTFLEFLRNIEHGNRTEFEHIAGIAFKKDGKVIKTKSRPIVENLDEIPFPARDLVNDEEFCGLTYRQAKPNTGMSITRGCPFRCVFCATQYRYQEGPLYRTRTPENIAAEADELYRLGYREIYLYADEINLDLKWTVAVCKALAGLNHPDLYFQCNLRCDPISDELVLWLKKANFWMVHLGIESSSDRVLVGIKKKMSRDKTLRAVRMLSTGGIKVFAFLMSFNYWEEKGQLMNETADEVRATQKFIYKLFLKRMVHYCVWTYSVPVPGAEFYEIAKRHKLIDDDYYPQDTWESWRYLKNVSKREFNSLYAAGRRQQGIFAAVTGNIEWKNWRAIRHKLWTAIAGSRPALFRPREETESLAS